MNSPLCCNNCGTVISTTAVPGSEGQSSFTVIGVGGFVVPALSAQVTISNLGNTDWMSVGNGYFIDGAGYFLLDTILSQTSATFTYLNITANTASGNTIPAGAKVVAGSIGSDGTDGFSVFAFLTAPLPNVTAIGDQVSATVSTNVMFDVGQTVFIADPSPGTDHGTFTVISKTGTTVMLVEFLGAIGDTAPAFIIGTGGQVTATGAPFVLAAALPVDFTDNSTGAASNTIAVGVGQFTHSIFFRAAAITGNVLLYTYTPGFAFKIIRISASVVDAITTAARAATLTTAIAAVPTTGGVVTLAGAYALGAEQASSAAITAANVGTLAQAITVTASAVTAFAEGGFVLHMEIQNMDSANAIASLAAHTDALIVALT